MSEAAAEEIGRRIRAGRELLGLTQTALARSCYVTQPAVSQWERGLTLPDLSRQFLLADALRTTRSRLFREIDTTEAAA